jgi:hypothetical protein
MKFEKLIVDNKEILNPNKINLELKSRKFYWLIEAEIEDAVIEIKNNTLVWHSGIFYSGIWEYGIWLSGEFKSGTWVNGIFESGIFNGEFKSGKIINGTINGEDLKNTE